MTESSRTWPRPSGGAPRSSASPAARRGPPWGASTAGAGLCTTCRARDRSVLCACVFRPAFESSVVVDIYGVYFFFSGGRGVIYFALWVITFMKEFCPSARNRVEAEERFQLERVRGVGWGLGRSPAAEGASKGGKDQRWTDKPEKMASFGHVVPDRQTPVCSLRAREISPSDQLAPAVRYVWP